MSQKSESKDNDETMNDAEEEEEEEEEAKQLISEEEEDKCKEIFNKLARSSKIRVEEALVIMKALSENVYFPEQDIYEVLEDDEGVVNTRRVDFEQFLELVREIKRRQNQANEGDTLDAYVAMGGQGDKSGCVDASKLIKIIKQDFEMTIDIEKLIEEVDDDGSGKIEYGEFDQLLNAG